MTSHSEIRDAPASEDPLGSVMRIVRRWKDQGRGQREVYDLLEELRQELRAEGRESAEDVLLEVMDLVSGFASERQRIWDEPLKTG